MQPGWTKLKLKRPYPSDVVHTAMLEVFPQLGVHLRYESILNLIIDARAGCSAAVPLESISVVISPLDDSSCEVLLEGHCGRDPDLPRDHIYPSNCGDIFRALDERLCSPRPICPLSFEEQLQINHRPRAGRKASNLWTLATVMFWGWLVYWLVK